MSDMDGQIASVLLPQITGSIPRMFLRIGEWGAGFVVFLMAVLLLSLEERTEVRYPALVPYVKIQKDYVAAAVLLTLYVVTMVVREVLEPKLMGKEMGLKPLYVLLSVYVGLKLFGVGGIVLGPIGLTILKTVFEQTSFSHTT